MKSEVFEKASIRVLQGKATKPELRVLVKWAETEIEEWQGFIKICKEKLKELNK